MQAVKQTIGIVMPLGSRQGGAEALLAHLLEESSGKYRIVCAFLQDGTAAARAKELGYDTIVAATTHLSDTRNFWRTVRELRRWVVTQKIDVLFSWMTKGHLYTGIAALGLPIKRVWYQHGVPEKDIVDRLATLIPTDAVLCCSKTSEQAQKKMLPRRSTYVCYPGVAMHRNDETSMSLARDFLSLPRESMIVGMVARLEHWKGVHVFVAAADYIFRRYPTAILFVVGGAHPADIQYQRDLTAMVRDLKCSDRFLLLGQRTPAETASWQAAADLIVHPVTGLEAFGMAVPEAMAQEKVVIASNAGGPAEVIDNGVNGVLVARGKAQMLSDAVITLLENPDKRQKIGAAACLRAQDFSIPRFVGRIDEIMHDILLH